MKRFLLGAFIVVIVTASFYAGARYQAQRDYNQTERRECTVQFLLFNSAADTNVKYLSYLDANDIEKARKIMTFRVALDTKAALGYLNSLYQLEPDQEEKWYVKQFQHSLISRKQFAKERGLDEISNNIDKMLSILERP